MHRQSGDSSHTEMSSKLRPARPGNATARSGRRTALRSGRSVRGSEGLQAADPPRKRGGWFKASLVAGNPPASSSRWLGGTGFRRPIAASLPKVSFEFGRGTTLETFDSRRGRSGLNGRKGTSQAAELAKTDGRKGYLRRKPVAASAIFPPTRAPRVVREARIEAFERLFRARGCVARRKLRPTTLFPTQALQAEVAGGSATSGASKCRNFSGFLLTIS